MKECCQCGHKAESGFVTFCDECYDNQEETSITKIFAILDTRESTGSSDIRDKVFTSLINAQQYLESLNANKIHETIYKDNFGHQFEIYECELKQ